MSSLRSQPRGFASSSPRIWLLLQGGVFILPLVPSVGGIVGMIGSAIWAWCKYPFFARQQPLNWLLGLLTLWLLLTSVLAPYQTEAWLGLANYLPFFFIFSSLHLLLRHPVQLRQIAWLMVIPSFLVVILGLGQLYLNWQTPYLLDWQLVAGGEPQGRMSSVFLYANFLAIYLQIVFILGLGLWLEALRRLREQRSFLSILHHEQSPFLFAQNPLPKQTAPLPKNGCKPLIFNLHRHQTAIFAFLTLTLGLDGIGLILTSSRNSWAIAFLAVMVFFLYCHWYKLILTLTSFCLAIAWSAIGPEPGKTWLRAIVPFAIWGRLSDEMYPNRDSATLRSTQWQFVLQMIQDHPWRGWGLRNFTPLYEAQMDLWLGHPHNLFLMFTAETGFIGMGLLTLFVGWILYQTVCLLQQWHCPSSPQFNRQDHLILFTYFIALSSCILFNLLDVTVFELRVNILTWVLLIALGGITSNGELEINQEASSVDLMLK